MRVAERVELAAFVGPGEAEAGLALADVAVARAEVTMHFAVGFGFPPAGFVEFAGFLEKLQVLHSYVPLFSLYAFEERAQRASSLRTALQGILSAETRPQIGRRAPRHREG